MTVYDTIPDRRSRDSFSVVRTKDGTFCSIFPKRLASLSQEHTSRLDAWAYIGRVIEAEKTGELEVPQPVIHRMAAE